MSRGEFEEIAHSGGKVTFHITREGDAVSYSIEVVHSRPTPAAWIAVYALPDGQPVADIELGGIGQSWNPPPTHLCYPVFVASDQGTYFGHECRGGCGRYWRSKAAPPRWHLTCPYCGVQRPTYSSRTEAQLRYIRHYVETLTAALQSSGNGDAVEIDWDEVLDSMETLPTPDFYYAEESQQCHFTCEFCQVPNDILGVYGYCCYCGSRNNLQLFKKQVEAVLSQLEDGRGAAESVKGLVSAFESCGRSYADELAKFVPMTTSRARGVRNLKFQNVDRFSRTMKQVFGIDVLDSIGADDREHAVLMFSRRHVYEHRAGVADEKYLDESGDQSVRPGQAIREMPGNVRALAPILVRMMEVIDQGFHEILPPVEDAEHHTRRRR